MANPKNMLYVGGLADEVKEENLAAVFHPFGDVVSVQMPIDPASKKHRGFGFVTFESADDAAQAMDNMDDAEFFGRVLKVNVAKPLKMGEKSRAVWNVDRDEYEIGKEGSGGGSGAPDDEKPTDGEAASKA